MPRNDWLLIRLHCITLESNGECEENKGNDHQFSKLLIIKQTLIVSTRGNIKRTVKIVRVWRVKDRNSYFNLTCTRTQTWGGRGNEGGRIPLGWSDSFSVTFISKFTAFSGRPFIPQKICIKVCKASVSLPRRWKAVCIIIVSPL